MTNKFLAALMIVSLVAAPSDGISNAQRLTRLGFQKCSQPLLPHRVPFPCVPPTPHPVFSSGFRTDAVAFSELSMAFESALDFDGIFRKAPGCPKETKVTALLGSN